MNEKFDTLGPLLTEVGREIAEIIDRDPDGAFLFANVGDNYAGAAIFFDEGNAVRWFRPTSELADLLMRIWWIDNAGKIEAEGWIYMEYDVRGEKFSASFAYQEDVRPGSYSDEWEEAAVKKRFGDKPVLYPPTPDWVLQSPE